MTSAPPQSLPLDQEYIPTPPLPSVLYPDKYPFRNYPQLSASCFLSFQKPISYFLCYPPYNIYISGRIKMCSIYSQWCQPQTSLSRLSRMYACIYAYLEKWTSSASVLPHTRHNMDFWNQDIRAFKLKGRIKLPIMNLLCFFTPSIFLEDRMNWILSKYLFR